ncbi:MAG: putative quinol monooxygenase [Acidimicrobiales bacterium]
MSVAVIAVFPVHPDKIDAFLTLFKAVLPDTRSFEGCELIETYIDQSDPGRVVVWERWPTKAHHRRYVAWRNESDLGEQMAPFLRDRITFTYLDARPDI